MKCEATFPINVKSSNQLGSCKVKCDLQCDYYNSVCVATNKETYISLSYEERAVPPVTFNGTSLYINEVRIYSPSLHKFENVTTDGEICIIHKGFQKNLVICIPIRKNGSDENLLNEIVEQSSTVIPNNNETSDLNLSDYNLSNFVPLNTPFIHYQCKVPFDCGPMYDVVVFGNRTDYVPIGDTHLEILQKLIRPEESYTPNDSMTYFVNEKGTVAKTGNKYSICYFKKDLPSSIVSKYDEHKKEGFVNMDSIIIDDNSMHLGYILLFILASYGMYLYISEVMHVKKSK